MRYIVLFFFIGAVVAVVAQQSVPLSYESVEQAMARVGPKVPSRFPM